MPRGPLPKPDARRRNAPTIPTTALPAAGRPGSAPRVPSNVTLEKSGKVWWRWAWSTPQAAAWDAGAVQLVARRASLEDDLATIGEVESLDYGEALNASAAMPDELRTLIRKLAALATGRLAIVKEMRETDRLLGLTPKSLAELRWKITAEEEGEGGKPALRVVADAADPRALLA